MLLSGKLMTGFGRLSVSPLASLKEPRRLRITPRDLALVKNIARLRLASTAQLAALDGGSAQNVSRAQWENGYVERPEAQASSRYLYEGSRPAIYGLTPKGAALLREHGLDVRRRLLDASTKSTASAGGSSNTRSRPPISWSGSNSR
jgi:hypothetical protein